MKRATPFLLLFALFALLLTACESSAPPTQLPAATASPTDSAPTPTRAPTTTPAPLTDCERAVKAASEISDMQDAIEDLDPAIQSCETLGEFLAATAKYPAALDGADGEMFARNRCTYNPSLANTALCKEIQ